MAAPTEVYVDPAIAGNSGTGTALDPYGDLQYAINTISAVTTPAIDNTNGVRFNVKAGTAEVLAATLSLASYDGTPSESAPLIIQGYTTSVGDGGIGAIDGDETYGCFTGEHYVHLRDLNIYDGGAAKLVDLGNGCSVVECEVHNTTGNCIEVESAGNVTGCNVYEGDAVGINLGNSNSEATNNYLKNGTNQFTQAISCGSASKVERNIISVDGGTNGIVLSIDSARAVHNTIFSAGGAGAGIAFSSAVKFNRVVENNYIEGFSGAGGDGIDFASISENGTIYRNNAFYGNTADETNKTAGECLIDEDNQLALGASAIAKSGANTFANRFTYFAPLAVIQADAYPSGARLDIGAVQHADPAGGGGMLRGNKQGNKQ